MGIPWRQILKEKYTNQKAGTLAEHYGVQAGTHDADSDVTSAIRTFGFAAQWKGKSVLVEMILNTQRRLAEKRWWALGKMRGELFPRKFINWKTRAVEWEKVVASYLPEDYNPFGIG